MDRADLIQRAREGDQGALDLLLAAHRDHLRRLADQALPGRLKARVDASDIVQQTCLSVFRKIADFQGSDPAQFAAWLQQVHERNIQNAVRDQLQTRKRGDGREANLEDHPIDEKRQDTPSEQAMEREEVLRLAQSLERLPDDERQVLRLRFLEGKTLAQLSNDLGLTKDAVVWLMQKGMKRLRQWLPHFDEPTR